MSTEGYKEDLAYIHDAGFGWFARQAAPQILQLLESRQIHSGRVVDLGCGSGILARELTHSGYDVLGIDQSSAMISLARVRAPRGRFRVGSVFEARLPPCSAVTAIGEILSYCLDESKRGPLLPGLFGRIFDALRPGGLLVFDVAELRLARGESPQQAFWQGVDWALLVETRKYPNESRIERHLTAFRRLGRGFRRSREVHRLRLYEPAEIEIPLRQVGFRIQRRRGYGSFEMLPGRVAFVAFRPA